MEIVDARPRTSVRIILPEQTLKDHAKIREEVDEQSLLMTALDGKEAERLGKTLDALDLKQGKERKSQVFYFSPPESIQPYYDLPSGKDLKSGASDVLENINGKILAAPGSIEVSGDRVTKKPVEFFNYLHTSTISSMMHQAKISLVLRDSDGEIIKTVPFNFSTLNNSKDINSMLSGKYESGFGAAIDSITITSDAQDPALSKFVTCDLQVRLSSGRYLNDYVNNSYDHPTKEVQQNLCIEDLFYTDKHEDIDTSGEDLKVKCSAEIKITMGYTEPAIGFVGTKKQKDELRKNMHNMTHSFFLKPTDYDYIAEPNGMVSLTVKYASSFDADMDSKTRKKINKSKKYDIDADAEILKNLVSQYQKNFSNATDSQDKEFNKFIDYMEKSIAITKQKNKHARIKSIIDEITDNGKRTMVLPYRITGLEREDKEPSGIVNENVIEEENKDNKLAAIRYKFYTARRREEFAAKAAPEEFSTLEALKTVDFVLFGDIIDYVFQEFFTYNKNSTEEVKQFNAAIFSSFSFAMYEHLENRDVYKLFSIRNTPVSIDLLWDILRDSKISQTEEGGFSKSTYYVDLVSKVYSSIYRSCDKISNLLSSKNRYNKFSHTIKKLGIPEINAHEIYIPLECFKDLNDARKTKNGNLGENVINSLVLNRARILAKGSSVSDTPDPLLYARVLFFTSHIPFSPTSKKIRPADFLFKSHGQYGIVKNLSYSPVDIEGLLESAIATRTRDQDPSQLNTENGDLYYKTLLKVDIETFGMPVVIPGQIVDVDRVLLAVEEDSKIARSLTNSFNVTRVTTTMDPTNFSTVIEGYPRLPENPGEEENRKPKKNPVLVENNNKINTFVKEYRNHLVSNSARASDRNYEELLEQLLTKFLNPKGPALINYFPSKLENDPQVVEYSDKLAEYAYNPGNWSVKPKIIHSGGLFGPGLSDATKAAAKQKGLDYSRINYTMHHPAMYGNNDFEHKADPTEVAVKTALQIQKESADEIAQLASMLGFDPPNGTPLDIGRCLRQCAEHLDRRRRSQRHTSFRSDNPYDQQEAFLLFVEILDKCFGIWKTAIFQDIMPKMDLDKKADLVNAIHSDSSDFPYLYGICTSSAIGFKRVLEDLRITVRNAKIEKISTNLEELVNEIINSGS